jgi:hypothetical protein
VNSRLDQLWIPITGYIGGNLNLERERKKTRAIERGRERKKTRAIERGRERKRANNDTLQTCKLISM